VLVAITTLPRRDEQMARLERRIARTLANEHTSTSDTLLRISVVTAS
jgi:hypothetical protein